MKNYCYDLASSCYYICRAENLKKSFFNDNRPFYGFKKITLERKQVIEEQALLWRSIQESTSSPPRIYFIEYY